MRRRPAPLRSWLTWPALIGLFGCTATPRPDHTAVKDTATEDAAQKVMAVAQEFVFEDAPFDACHASTIAETDAGLVAAWFAGTREGGRDVGVWIAHRGRADSRWSEPRLVADGVVSPDERYPCWNPVLHATRGNELILFYKVGPSPRRWWGVIKTSTDGGGSWSAATRLPDGQLGPIKNKPVALPSGELLCGSSTEHDGWRVHMERCAPDGTAWARTEPLDAAGSFGAIQPTILTHAGDRLQILCRATAGHIAESFSDDGGRTWSALAASALPNPNSGIDAVTLADGRHLLVYNHTPRGRTPLCVAISPDGRRWNAALVLESEPGEYSYPAVIQTADGLVHVTYTWKRRRIRHAVIDPAVLQTRPIEDARWPRD